MRAVWNRPEYGGVSCGWVLPDCVPFSAGLGSFECVMIYYENLVIFVVVSVISRWMRCRVTTRNLLILFVVPPGFEPRPTDYEFLAGDRPQLTTAACVTGADYRHLAAVFDSENTIYEKQY